MHVNVAKESYSPSTVSSLRKAPNVQSRYISSCGGCRALIRGETDSGMREPVCQSSSATPMYSHCLPATWPWYLIYPLLLPFFLGCMCNCSSDAVGFLFFEVAFGIYDSFWACWFRLPPVVDSDLVAKWQYPSSSPSSSGRRGELASIRAVGQVIRGEAPSSSS